MFGFIGSIASSLIGSHSAKQTSQANIEAAREAMQNRHQWEVDDLKKAGLNPILSAHGSTGTTSGSGVAYTPENPLAGFQERQNAKKLLQAQLEEKDANINSAKADADLKNATATEVKQRIAHNVLMNVEALNQARSNSAKAAAEAHNATLFPALNQAQIEYYGNTGKAAYSKAGPYAVLEPITKFLTENVSSAIDAFKKSDFMKDYEPSKRDYNYFFD